jgi:hypothetical protein
MSLPRPNEPYHFQANLIWLDIPCKGWSQKKLLPNVNVNVNEVPRGDNLAQIIFSLWDRSLVNSENTRDFAF